MISGTNLKWHDCLTVPRYSPYMSPDARLATQTRQQSQRSDLYCFWAYNFVLPVVQTFGSQVLNTFIRASTAQHSTCSRHVNASNGAQGSTNSSKVTCQRCRLRIWRFSAPFSLLCCCIRASSVIGNTKLDCGNGAKLLSSEPLHLQLSHPMPECNCILVLIFPGRSASPTGFLSSWMVWLPPGSNSQWYLRKRALQRLPVRTHAFT